MAKQKTILTTNLGDFSLEKPAEILSTMKELQASLLEADEFEALKIQVQLNALSKAFSKALTESFKCSDDVIEEQLQKKGIANSGYDVSINNVSYIYTKETVIKPEIDKSFLTSQGCKTQKDYYDKLESEGQPIPASLKRETKEITKFDPDKWNGEPFAKEVSADVVDIKETKIKK